MQISNLKLQISNHKWVMMLMLFGSVVRADSVFVGPLERKNATVIDVKDDNLIFDVNGRRVDPQPLERITRIVVASETALNQAEELFAQGKYAESIEPYQRASRSASKQWIKDFTSIRLLDAAGKTGRFDAAASAYVAMLAKEPSTATKYKPELPDEKSTYLDSALKDVDTAMLYPRLTDEQRIALLGFALELYTHKKDAAAMEATAAKLDELLARDPTNPRAAQAVVRRKLQGAQAALDKKDFAAAQREIESNRATFAEPIQQAEALFILAEAKRGLAEISKDPNALKDAALAYMRVVAHFKDVAGKPYAPQSLLHAAELQEQLKEPKVALQLYDQIVAQYPDDAVAAVAKKDAARLRSGS